jgi:DnaJ-class molecular chaperone
MKRYNINIDYYKILGLSMNSNQQEIHQAYLVIARKFHPYLFSQSVEERKRMNKVFQLVNEAYSVLKDPEIKKEYDEIRLLNSNHEKQTFQVKCN